MRRVIVLAACAVVTAALAVPARAGSTSTAKSQGRATEYVVLYRAGASMEQAHAAVKAAGGTIVKENEEVGLATVRSARHGVPRRRAPATGGRRRRGQPRRR
jgi:hypothetical protein